MIKRFLAILFVVLCFSQTTHFVQAQAVKIEGKTIIYDLPYAGILPDSPLYPIKIIRDRLLEFLTRDYYKKVHLYLEDSDKRVSMAMALSEKGKWHLATSTLNKAEIYSSKIFDLGVTSKKQGVTFPTDFSEKVRQSNLKHEEIIENLIFGAPQEEQQNLQQALKINRANKKKFSSL